MKTRTLVIIAVVVLAIVGAAIWFLQMPIDPGSVAVATPPPVEPTPRGPVSTATPPPVKATPPKVVETSKAPTAPPSATPRPLAEWEARIDQVLRMNTTETESAQLLINMLPSLPPEGQAEAAQHISNLILDKDYGRVKPLLTNPSLPEEVHDVLFTDLMNREDGVKLPALLDVAKIPNHPYHEEALTDLQIFLDQDNEQNWGKWDGAVKEYLKKQAAEEAAANAPDAAPPAGTQPGAGVPKR